MRKERLNSFAEAGQTPKIDATKITENGIKDILIVMEGEAKGHGAALDKLFIEQIYSLFVAAGQIQCHFGHYNDCTTQDEIETLLGVFENPRLDEKNGMACVVADLVWIKTALSENAINHVTEWAKSQPSMIGNSIVFSYEYREHVAQGNEDDDYYEGDTWEEGMCPYDAKTLEACDIVNHPAATDNLFLSEAGKATQYLSRFEKINPSAVQNIKEFAKKYFNLSEMKTKKSILSRIADTMGFDKNKPTTEVESPKNKFGESVGNDGMLYTYDGDSPSLGDTLMVRASDAPIEDAVVVEGNADYVMSDGVVIGVNENGVIDTLHTESPEDIQDQPMEGDPTPDAPMNTQEDTFEKPTVTAEEEEAYKAKDAQKMQKAKETEKNTAPLIKRKMNSEESIQEGLNLLAKAKLAERAQGKSPLATEETRKYEKRFKRWTKSEREQFATDFTGVAARCQKYLVKIWQNLGYIDPIFAETTPVEWRGVYDANNVFSVKMPMTNVSGISGRITKTLDPKVCGVPVDATKVVGSERVITACFYDAVLNICSREFRDIFDGATYVGTTQIPMEAIIIEEFLNRVWGELAMDLVNGTAGVDGAVCTGIYPKIKAAVTASQVPAAQVFGYTAGDLVPFTESNVIEQITKFVMATPMNIRDNGAQGKGKSLRLYTSQYLFDLFYTAYAKTNTSYAELWWQLQANINPDMPLSSTIYVPGVPFPIKFVPLTALNNNASLATSKMFIALKEEIGHLEADLDGVPQPVVDYQPRSRDFVINAEGAIGINFAFAANLVAAVD